MYLLGDGLSVIDRHGLLRPLEISRSIRRFMRKYAGQVIVPGRPCGQSPRPQGDPRVARPSVDYEHGGYEHGGFYGASAEPLQGILGRGRARDRPLRSTMSFRRKKRPTTRTARD